MQAKMNGEQLYLIDQAIRDICMRKHITDAEGRVGTLYREYGSALHKMKYADLQVTRHHLAIDHIIKSPKPQ